MRALWDNFRFNKPKNKYSLEHLKYLYSIISKNPIINEQNKVIIIETLRQIAELLIWGDQHNSVFFDFFLEKNLLAFFLNILDQKTNKNVKVQLLQTLSILVENIKAQNSLYYLFSNNHVNELIIHKFDFSDEEVLAYYISLLKTLSLKLDKSTIQFFFNAQENDFPLYTEAIKFFNHEEGMIRIAVRTLTLNVYRVEDELMRKYILNSTAVPYFSNIVWFIRQQCQTLDQMVRTTSHDNRRKLDDFVAEMLDHFYYLHDIFCLGIETMSLVLSEQLLNYLLTPLLVESLGPATLSPEKKDGGDDDKISPVLALFLLSQVFTVFTHKPLINTIAAALIHPDPATFSALKQLCPVGPPPPLSDLASKRTHYVSFRRFSSVPNLELLESNILKGTMSAPPSPVPPVNYDSDSGIKSPQPPHNEPESKFITQTPSKSSPSLLSLDEPQQRSSLDTSIPSIEVVDLTDTDKSQPAITPRVSDDSIEKGRNVHRDALLGFFEDDRTALNALCMLVALIKNEAVDKDLLEIGGLFPYRLTKAKYLLDILTNNSNAKPLAIPALAHVKEESLHTRSKSDSHAVTTAILDFNLRRKLPGYTLPQNTPEAPTSPTETDNETSATNLTNTSVDESEISTPDVDGDLSSKSLKSFTNLKKLTPAHRHDEHSKQSSSHQNAFTHSLIGRLLSLLVRSNQYRLVTLQVTLTLLKELVCSPDSPPGLTPRQLATFEKAYRFVASTLEERLGGEIFLELFDLELKAYKPPNFEYLIKDAALLLPVSGTSKSRLDLTRRLPSGEAEKTQKAIQQYLVLRELKYTILHKKDDVLPHLKQHIPNVTVSPKDQYTLENTSECIVIPFVTIIVGASMLKKRQKRQLVVNKESLIVLDPTTVTKQPSKSELFPASATPDEPRYGGGIVAGTVVHAAPLQSIDLEIDRNDPLVLQVTSHPTTWSMPMVFEDEKRCQAAYELLTTARSEIRVARIHKIRSLLATSEDKTVVSPSSYVTHPESTKELDLSGFRNGEEEVTQIDSIIHTLESINRDALKHSTTDSPKLPLHTDANSEDHSEHRIPKEAPATGELPSSQSLETVTSESVPQRTTSTPNAVDSLPHADPNPFETAPHSPTPSKPASDTVTAKPTPELSSPLQSSIPDSTISDATQPHHSESITTAPHQEPTEISTSEPTATFTQPNYVSNTPTERTTTPTKHLAAEANEPTKSHVELTGQPTTVADESLSYNNITRNTEPNTESTQYSASASPTQSNPGHEVHIPKKQLTTEVATQPIEPIALTEPTQPAAKPITEPVAEHATEQHTEQPTEQLTEQLTEPTDQPTEPPTTEPSTEQPTAHATTPTTESIESAVEPATELATAKEQLITGQPTKPAEPITEPTEPTTEHSATTETATEQPTEPTTEPQAELEPTTEHTTEPTDPTEPTVTEPTKLTTPLKEPTTSKSQPRIEEIKQDIVETHSKHNNYTNAHNNCTEPTTENHTTEHSNSNADSTLLEDNTETNDAEDDADVEGADTNNATIDSNGSNGEVKGGKKKKKRSKKKTR